MKTNSFKDLIVWQKSMDLVQQIYNLTDRLPASEKYGLSNQLRRAAVSVPSNIAEGYRRNNRREYIQFCGIAAGSLGELETQLLIISRTFSFIDVSESLKLVDEVSRILNSFIKSLKETATRRSTLNAVR